MTEIVGEHVHVEGDPPCNGCGWHIPPAGPKLVHSGIYSLYETPDGGRHLVYRQLEAIDEQGLAQEVDSGDMHLPDIPPAALPLVNSFLENGFPPAILSLLSTMTSGKGMSRTALAKALPGLIGGLNGTG